MTRNREHPPVQSAKHLHELLKRDIETHKYAPGEKLPSVRELSVAYQVNKSTVVNVLATLANAGLIRTEAGKGSFVLAAKEELKQIAVLFFDSTLPIRVDTEILAHIQKNIKSGYYLSLHDTSQNYRLFEQKIEALVESGNVHGFIAIPPKWYTPQPDDVARLNRLLGDRIPLVFIIRNIDGVSADYFSMDLDKGVQKAVAYLSSNNKKRICVIKHDSQKFVDEELRGLEIACSKHQIPIYPEYILEFDENIETVKSRLLSILDEIDAIIASDLLLCSLQGVLRDSGKRIPEDLSIIGINDVVSHFFHKPLTSIRFPVEQIGIHAIHTIISRLENEGGAEKTTKNIVPDLVIRET